LNELAFTSESLHTSQTVAWSSEKWPKFPCIIADVLISYLSEDEDAESVKKLIRQEGRRCITVEGDISEEDH
jgi:hypothetical protein